MGFLRRPLVVRARLLSAVCRLRRLWVLPAVVLVPSLLSRVLPRAPSSAGVPGCSAAANDRLSDAPYAWSRRVDASRSPTNHPSAEAADNGHLSSSQRRDAHHDNPTHWRHRPDAYGDRSPVTRWSRYGEPTPREPHAHRHYPPAVIDAFTVGGALELRVVEGKKHWAFALDTIDRNEQEPRLEQAVDRWFQHGSERPAWPQPLNPQSGRLQIGAWRKARFS